MDQQHLPHGGAFRNANLRPVPELLNQELPGGPRKLGMLTFEKHSCQAKWSVPEQTCLGRWAGLQAKDQEGAQHLPQCLFSAVLALTLFCTELRSLLLLP